MLPSHLLCFTTKHREKEREKLKKMNTKPKWNSLENPKKKHNPTSIGTVATSTTTINSDQTTPANTNTKPLFSFQFPTSPQPNVGHELLYTSTHPQHPLARVSVPDLFTCSGCKEYGAGKRVCCLKCEFQLHEFCALTPLNYTLNYHPLHTQHQLFFHTKSKAGKGGMLCPKCDVCGKAMKGFTFKCHSCNFQIHPCCAMLTTEMKFPTHPHALKLLPSIPSGSGPYAIACSECGHKQSGSMIYVCTVCNNYYLHAVCAKNVINGLHGHGIKPVLEKPSKLGYAAHAASVVFMEFVSGIIEGIGEGVGDAIFQDIGRDRDINGGSSSSTTNTKGKKITK